MKSRGSSRIASDQVTWTKSVRVEDLIMSSSQEVAMCFSEVSQSKVEDHPSKSESISELMEELGEESQHVDSESCQNQKTLMEKGKRDKKRTTHLFKSGDKKALQIFLSPFRSVDNLVVSQEQEWQLSLIQEWMPGVSPELESPAASSQEKETSQVDNGPIFFQPTFRSSPPSHYVSRREKEQKHGENRISSEVKRVSDASLKRKNTAFSPEDDDCYTPEKKAAKSLPSSWSDKKTGKSSRTSNSETFLCVRTPPDQSSCSQKGAIVISSDSSDSLFSPGDVTDLSSPQNKSPMSSMRRVWEGDCDTRKAGSSSGVSSKDGLRLGIAINSNSSHIDESHSGNTTDQAQYFQSKPSGSLSQFSQWVEDSPILDTSLEVRYRMVDECLIQALGVLKDSSESRKGNRQIPQSGARVILRKLNMSPDYVKKEIVTPEKSAKYRHQNPHNSSNTGLQSKSRSLQSTSNSNSRGIDLKSDKGIVTTKKTATDPQNRDRTAYPKLSLKVHQTTRKRTHQVAIKVVPANCEDVLKISKGILISDDILKNKTLFHLINHGAPLVNAVKQEVLDTVDTTSETTSEKEDVLKRNDSRNANKDKVPQLALSGRSGPQHLNGLGGRSHKSDAGEKGIMIQCGHGKEPANSALPDETRGPMSVEFAKPSVRVTRHSKAVSDTVISLLESQGFFPQRMEEELIDENDNATQGFIPTLSNAIVDTQSESQGW